MNNYSEWFPNEADTHPGLEEIVKVKLGDDGTRELYAMYAPFDTAPVLWFSIHGPVNHGPVKWWRRISIQETQEWRPKIGEVISRWQAGSARRELQASSWR
ncbi:MAG TPA: hypothetical protein VN999_17995 [Thermoanaerobaculia bacterium]|nr:hypothetical protein [Thermoanaerobaculia bacterium]